MLHNKTPILRDLQPPPPPYMSSRGVETNFFNLGGRKPMEDLMNFPEKYHRKSTSDQRL